MKEINMLTGRCSLYVLFAAAMVCCAVGCKDPCDGTQSCPGLQLPWYRDADGDGYSDGIKVCSLSQPGAGYYLTCQLVGPEVDCNDADPNVYSGATGVCDGVDNNCDGQIDEGLKITFYRDLDGDGYGNTVESTPACSAPAGYVAKSGDCDDSNAAMHPGTQEVCDDGIDNNCDGIVDNCTNPPATVWKPRPGTSWQWQLTGTIDTSFDVDMYDIDLFDSSASLIEQLHNDGRIVICYFSAGSWEDWRPDADKYPSSVKGKALEGWPDEKWLDIRNIDVLGPLIDARLDMAVSKGCDGVEPDNVDAYTNDSGFPLTANDQLQFNRWLAEHAHARELSVGLKNDLDQVSQLVDDFDWALNEQCFEYDECDMLLPFVKAGKAVFGVEYELDTAEFCAQANAMDFDWLKKNYDLDAERESCR